MWRQDKGHTMMLGSSSMQRSGIKIQVSRNLRFTKQFDVSKKWVALKIAYKQTETLATATNPEKSLNVLQSFVQN